MEKAPFTSPEKPDLNGYSVPGKGAPDKTDRASRMIEEAERPLLYVGGGMSKQEED